MAPHSAADRPSPPSSADRLYHAATGFQLAAALKTGLELDFFTAVGEGQRTAAALATRCRIAPRGARMLADFLTINGLLTKQGDQYALTNEAALFLDRRSPSFAQALEYIQAPHVWNQFSALTERVRLGGAPPSGDNVLAPDHEVWTRFARAMGNISFQPAQLLARHIMATVQPRPANILDIAAGHGIYGIAFAQQNPSARITGQDWPTVLPVALENARKFRVADRYQTLPGSAFEVDFGTGFDLVLISNFLHNHDPATNVRLLAKARDAVQPGGTVLTLEYAPNDDRISPPALAAFAIFLLATTPAGDAYTVSELTAMYQDAGFQNVAAADLPGGQQRLITGQRPA